MDVLNAALDEARRGDVRQPAVGPVDDPLARPLGTRADQNRRVRLLHRLGDHVGLGDVDELAAVLGLVLGPHHLHRLDPLFGHLPAVGEAHAERFHLLGQPASADAEEEASAGDHVQAGDLLGQRDRLVLGHKTDAGAQLELGRRAGRRAQPDERVVNAAVLVGQRTVGRAGELRLAIDGHMHVLRREERVEAALFGGGRQCDRIYSQIRRENEHAMLHWDSSSWNVAPVP